MLAIGNPFGVGQTVTSGIISALARTQVGDQRLSASSSRPMRRSIRAIPAARWSTMDGKLVGINTAIYLADRRIDRHRLRHSRQHGRAAVLAAELKRRASRSGPGSASAARRVTRRYRRGPGPRSADRRHRRRGLSRAVPRPQAGLKRGDVIIAINGQSVEDAGSLRFRLATLDRRRDGDTLGAAQARRRSTIPVRLIAPPETPPAQTDRARRRASRWPAPRSSISRRALAERAAAPSEWKRRGRRPDQARQPRRMRLGLRAGRYRRSPSTAGTWSSVERCCRTRSTDADGSWDDHLPPRRARPRTLRIG